MLTKFYDKKLNYDGSQLRPLFNYLDHGLLGDSCVAFIGQCDVSFDHMVDGEDLLEKSQIKSDEMLHFLFEVFDTNLMSGVFLQRLFASIVQNLIYKKTGQLLARSGDDLYLNDQKLSISIATRSINSGLVNFAMNVTNAGTPVKTLSLQDLKIEPINFAKELLQLVSAEYVDIKKATYKVKCV